MNNIKAYEPKHIKWIDILKGIGIILVVFGHVHSNDIIYNWIYSFHMPLFFFAGGCVYKKKDVLEDIKRRLNTIVIPYFSFGFLILVYWQLVERKFRYSELSFWDSVVGLFRGQFGSLEFNVHLWFLPAFFVTVILFNLLQNIGGKKLTHIVVILMSVAFVVFPLPELVWGIDRVFKFIGFYAIGNIFADYKVDKQITKCPILIKVIISGILVLGSFALTYYRWDKNWMWYITGIIGIVAVAVISIAMKRSKLLERLGKSTLAILCVHGPVYRVLIKVLSMVLNITTDEVRFDFVLSIIITVITLCISTLIFEILAYFVPWMVGKKRGG